MRISSETDQPSGLDDVESVVRHLVGLVELADSKELIEPRMGDERVLLDVEVDDVRCLILRQAQPSLARLLSPREREVARMVALGYPNKTIASVLDISSWTVSSHLRRIFTKLGVSSRTAMATRLSLEHVAPAGRPEAISLVLLDEYDETAPPATLRWRP